MYGGISKLLNYQWVSFTLQHRKGAKTKTFNVK